VTHPEFIGKGTTKPFGNSLLLLVLSDTSSNKPSGKRSFVVYRRMLVRTPHGRCAVPLFFVNECRALLRLCKSGLWKSEPTDLEDSITSTTILNEPEHNMLGCIITIVTIFVKHTLTPVLLAFPSFFSSLLLTRLDKMEPRNGVFDLFKIMLQGKDCLKMSIVQNNCTQTCRSLNPSEANLAEH
jgi:hypothetical protein